MMRLFGERDAVVAAPRGPEAREWSRCCSHEARPRASRARRLVVRAALVSALASGLSCGGPDGPAGCEITAVDAEQILLRDVEGVGSGERSGGPCVAFFGASDGLSEAVTVIGRGTDGANAVRAAMGRWSAVTDRPLGEQVWWKLDVVAAMIPFAGVRSAETPPDEMPGMQDTQGVEVTEGTVQPPLETDSRRPPARPTTFQSAERSLYGVADADFEVALLPEEIMAHRVVDDRHRFRLLQYDAFRDRHPHRATEDPPIWTWRFRSQSYFLDRTEPQPTARRLFRGQHAGVRTDLEALDQGAELAMDYLQRGVTDDGRFVYSYSPVANRVDTSYNMVRHAGTVYAMLELYGLHPERRDPDLLAAADRATDHLLGEIRPCPRLRYEPKADDVPDHHRRHGMCLVEANESKLGGHGLALLALLQHPDIARRPERLEVAIGLGERILSVLRPDGRFDPHKVRWSDGTHFVFDSEYYPGEAIYGLTRLFRVTGDRRWLHGARRASDYRVRVRYAPDGAFTDETIPHDHWLAYGLRELAELDPRPWDAEYLRRLGRLIVEAQHGPTVDPPDWAGGFYEPPRTAPTATRAEALGSILAAVGSPDAVPPGEWELFADALCRAVTFQLRTQYTPARSFYFEAPQRALGGLSGSLTDDEIRIDFPQHTSSSLVAAMRRMERGDLTCPGPVGVGP